MGRRLLCVVGVGATNETRVSLNTCCPIAHLNRIALDASSFTHSQRQQRTMTSAQRPIVFMDVNIGETPAGRLKMELFSDIVPKCVASSSCDIYLFTDRCPHVPQDCREFPTAMHGRVQGQLEAAGL